MRLEEFFLDIGEDTKPSKGMDLVPPPLYTTKSKTLKTPPYFEDFLFCGVTLYLKKESLLNTIKRGLNGVFYKRGECFAMTEV